MRKVALFVLIGMIGAASVFAQQTYIIKGQKNDPARGSIRPANCVLPVTDVVAPRPDETKPMYSITFINNTGYFIDIYLLYPDNFEPSYFGRIEPWENFEATSISCFDNWYATTMYGDYEWSSANYQYNCYADVVVFQL